MCNGNGVCCKGADPYCERAECCCCFMCLCNGIEVVDVDGE